MTDEDFERLESELRANPNDDQVRTVFADALDERGDRELATFVRAHGLPLEIDEIVATVKQFLVEVEAKPVTQQRSAIDLSAAYPAAATMIASSQPIRWIVALCSRIRFELTERPPLRMTAAPRFDARIEGLLHVLTCVAHRERPIFAEVADAMRIVDFVVWSTGSSLAIRIPARLLMTVIGGAKPTPDLQARLAAGARSVEQVAAPLGRNHDACRDIGRRLRALAERATELRSSDT